jgi:hypothetical protein
MAFDKLPNLTKPNHVCGEKVMKKKKGRKKERMIPV